MEKNGQTLLAPVGVSTRPKPSNWQRYLRAAFVVLFLIWCTARVVNPISSEAFQTIFSEDSAEICAQLSPLLPSKHAELSDSLDDIYSNADFPAEAAELLGGCVRVPTEVYDSYGEPAVDPQWEKFFKLHEYLAKAFPLVHETLRLTKVNTYGLVYAWAGSDDSLKPLMLTAHQDVVPIDPQTLSQWLHPPFSGYYDGEWIWGRGAGDQKSGMIGILIAVETLIKQGFKPTRSVILAFGFDEEASGRYGAEAISRYVMTTYGLNSIGLLVDEGGGLLEQGGTLFASPCVGEKGYIDIKIEVTTPGGHSSVPPPHTGLGHLGAILYTLEKNPFPVTLSRTNPYYNNLQCQAEFATLPPSLSKDIKSSVKDDAALKRVGAQIASTKQGRAILSTTQAADIVGGGSVKVNALPEKVFAVVNHRISVDSSVREVKNRFVELLHPFALENHLGLTAFGLNFTSPGPTDGQITLEDAFGTALEPAPVSPHMKGEKSWDLLSGTIRGLYPVNGVVVAPSTIGGNTDTRYYWLLTSAIYRYGGMNSKDSYNGAHTVNEAIRATGLVDRIKFFTRIILNTDEADL